MKAIAAQSGAIVLTDIEQPALPPGHLRIKTEYSAISPGTEMSFIKKGSEKTIVLGYSAVGIIEQMGEGVSGYKPGQRVACYGAPYARHAEWLTVPANLTALVPEHVDPEEAAFAGLGAIAAHALRTAALNFGESAVVVGLGILGNVIAQMSHAAAYRTVGLDLLPERVEQLRARGIRHAYSTIDQMRSEWPDSVGGHGADAVLLCASGSGEKLINESLSWIRDRGKIVIVGDLTTEFSRGAMFAKEAQVLISRAGGPGRYDTLYERDNCDYPIGYIRWTEGRNIGEYIRLLAEGRITVKPLITHRYPLDRASEAYANYMEAKPDTVGTLIQYS